jgi:hypothetical protein
MALITIGGQAVATPSEFSVTINDISKADRNALGNLTIERIATKRTIVLGWAFLNQSDTSNVLGLVSATSFSVTYPDPQTGANRTSTFYCGDRSLGLIDFQGGVPRYKDIKFTLIEL